MPIINNEYTLLIIESSPEELEKIRKMVQEAEFNVITACTQEEGIRKAQRHLPDLILLDREESAEKEFMTIRELKKNEITKDIPVLFCTSIRTDSGIPESLAYDNIDFIVKPLHKKELIIRIQHQLFLLEAQRTILKQNEKLKRIIESRDKMYSIIAHDLRAPIGTIKMINTAIESRREHIHDSKVSKYFEMINETTEEAFNLLENLLRWSRNQNGKTKVSTTTFNLTNTVRQVVSLFSTIANNKNIELRNNIKQEHMTCADEDMVKTVLRNLLSNAIKFTFSEGRIDINATEANNYIILAVKDNGIGIKKELQHRLLRNDEHLSTHGTGNEKGSGLGLLLCRDFVKMNKGKIWFTSTENQGTTFYFSIPKSKSKETSLPAN